MTDFVAILAGALVCSSTRARLDLQGPIARSRVLMGLGSPFPGAWGFYFVLHVLEILHMLSRPDSVWSLGTAAVAATAAVHLLPLAEVLLDEHDAIQRDVPVSAPESKAQRYPNGMKRDSSPES